MLAFCMVYLRHVNCGMFKCSPVTIWQVPDFKPVVRDRLMNSTFNIISPHFLHFTRADWILWFRVKLVPVLPSFSPTMLQNATSNLSCTNYHVVWVIFDEQARLHGTNQSKKKMLWRDCVRSFLFCLCSVSGLARAFPAMSMHTRQGIADNMVGYLRSSPSVINQTGTADAVKCAVWLLVCASFVDLKLWNSILKWHREETGTRLVPCVCICVCVCVYVTSNVC